MNNDDIVKSFEVGSKHILQPSEVHDFGAFFKISESVTGYLPTKELSWTEKIVDAREIIQIGKSVDVVVIDVHAGNKTLITLSHKQYYQNPWFAYIKKLSLGERVSGLVIRVYETVAHIELDGGVLGELHLSDSIMGVSTMEKVVLVGDTITAYISKFDHSSKRIILGVIRHIEKEQQTASTPIGHQYKTLFEKLKFQMEKETSVDYGLDGSVHNKIQFVFLYGEHQIDIEANNQILKKLGFEVIILKSIEEFKSYKLKLAKGLVIISIKKFGNLASTILLRLIELKSKIIIQTTNASDVDPIFLKNNANQLVVLDKPCQSKHLVRSINTLASNRQRKFIATTLSDNKSDLWKNLSKSIEKNAISSDSINNILNVFHNQCGATISIVFKIHLTTFDIEIESCINFDQTVKENQLHLLRFSPVKDVIYDDVDLLSSKSNYKRFKYLKKLISFQSILGHRIPYKDEYGYGIFLFSNETAKFDSVDNTAIREFSIVLTEALQKKKFGNMVSNEHNLIIEGKLGLALIHEIKNEHQNIFSLVDILKQDSVDLNSGLISTNSEEFLARFQRITKTLEEVNNNIQGIYAQFLNYNSEDETYDNMDSFLSKINKLFKPTLDKKSIDLQIICENNRSSKLNTGYLQQAISNLILNSIEHIEVFRKRTGIITIKVINNNNGVIILEIADNGIGIHQSHREKIFDLFFSTKMNGTGIGLFISRALLESMGGSLELEETSIFGGTSFRISLPVNL